MAVTRNETPRLWEKVVAVLIGAAMLGIVLCLTVIIPQPTDTQWFVFRITLATAAAGLGVVLPGLLSIEIKPFVRGRRYRVLCYCLPH